MRYWRETTIVDWLKLGYTKEQSEELNKASKYFDLMTDIDAENASKQLAEWMKSYHIDKEGFDEFIDKFNKIPN